MLEICKFVHATAGREREKGANENERVSEWKQRAKETTHSSFSKNGSLSSSSKENRLLIETCNS